MNSVNQSKDDRAELEAYLTGFWLTDFSNFASFLYWKIPDLNWVGFYLDRDGKLVLGPFCGKPACTEIAYNRGVCGKSFSEKKILIVDDVEQFPGHITCDTASKSEMVFPVFMSNQLIGVLDIDSPKLSRFGSFEKNFISDCLESLNKKTNFDPAWLK